MMRRSMMTVPAALLAGVFAIPQVLAATNISDQYAWSCDAGWANFNPTNVVAADQVEVTNKCLKGYAWLANLGWLRLGDTVDGGTGQYLNTTSTNWGVNNNPGTTALSTLSGYAWSPNVGWINFSPANGGVTIQTISAGVRKFSGYAWSANVGWINMEATVGTTYNVSTVWTGDAQ